MQRFYQLRMIVKLQLAYLVCDKDFFKDWAYLCGKDDEVANRMTIARDLLEGPVQMESAIRTILQNVGAKISLTFDIWTAPNGGKYLAFTGHWLTKNFKAKEITLQFELLEGQHTNVELRAQLEILLQRWCLQPDQIGTMTSNSAGENLKMMEDFAATTE